MEFDFVITLCDNAQKTCPTFPAKTSVVHMGFDQTRFIAGLKSVLDQLPKDLTGKKFSTNLSLVYESMPIWRPVVKSGSDFPAVGAEK